MTAAAALPKAEGASRGEKPEQTGPSQVRPARAHQGYVKTADRFSFARSLFMYRYAWERVAPLAAPRSASLGPVQFASQGAASASLCDRLSSVGSFVSLCVRRCPCLVPLSSSTCARCGAIMNGFDDTKLRLTFSSLKPWAAQRATSIAPEESAQRSL